MYKIKIQIGQITEVRFYHLKKINKISRNPIYFVYILEKKENNSKINIFRKSISNCRQKRVKNQKSRLKDECFFFVFFNNFSWRNLFRMFFGKILEKNYKKKCRTIRFQYSSNSEINELINFLC